MPAYPPPSEPQHHIAPAAWLKSPVGLSKALTALFGAMIAADLLSLWGGVTMYAAFGDLLSEEYAESLVDSAERAEVLYSFSGVFQVAVRVALIVVFLVWFHRVRVNAEVFAPDGHAKGRAWTIWGWFVPFVNFVFPRRIASDIWRASESGEKPGSRRLLNWWWALFLLTWMVERYASRMYVKAETIGEIQSGVQLMMISDAVDIAAAVLALLFVRRLTAMQTERALAGPSTPPFVPNLPAL